MGEDAPDARSIDGGEARFYEAWSLHALRYGAVLVGVLAWLWGAKARVALPALLSLCLIFELPLHGPRVGRFQPLWAALQCSAAAAAFAASPGMGTALILSAVIGGAAAVLSFAWAAGVTGIGAASVALAYFAGGRISLESSFACLIAVAASAWVGRQFALRVEEANAHRRTVAELERAQERIARLAEKARELAAAEERQRVSEELHDTLGHALVGTLLQAQIAQRLIEVEPKKASVQLASMEQSLKATLDRVRQALRQGLDSRARLAIDEALRQLAGDFQAAGGPNVEVAIVPGPESVSDVSPEVADALYRTAQEALTNAVRHGRARNVRIELEATGPRLYLRIRDDGVGASDYSPGMGLAGMVSRVQALGGALRFETAPGEGFCVEVGVKRS